MQNFIILVIRVEAFLVKDAQTPLFQFFESCCGGNSYIWSYGIFGESNMLMDD